MNDRLIGLQQIKDQEKEHYESELQKLRTDYQEMKDQLTSENMILGKRFHAASVFSFTLCRTRFGRVNLWSRETSNQHVVSLSFLNV